ncbi:FAD-binding protein [Kineococcus aurantiacus]|uniref:FAD/FMN-containing dehydrogenase n=1 Tax=Kineococcus aurantiacus TaxID=37633 RepID=A0A7Y9J1H0_9ACTN|nr:FAD/FMN-containing dehydrogenase [Kineococcus aurantiacus]
MDHGRPTRRALLATGLALATAGCTDGGAQSPPTPGGDPGGGPSSPPTTPGWSDLEVSGGLSRPGQAGYDPSTLLYNPRFSPAPQAVAHCRTADDVAACVRHAGRTGTGLRLRAGGHSYGGWSAGDGLVADLAGMDAVELAADGRTARIGAGARLVDVYTALGAQGVAIGAGSCPTVGFSGLTLGGGVGVLARSFGLTCDQVRSIDVVTADGTSRTVDAGNDPDLFWALRGGGGGIAAVTSWTVAVRSAPRVTVFFLRWGLERGADVLAAWQRWAPTAPRELWSTCKLLRNPADGDRVQVSGAWTGTAALDLSGLLAELPPPAANTHRTLGYLDAMLYEAGCSGLDAQACTARALDGAHRQPFAATSSMLGTELPQAGLDAALAAVRELRAPAGLVEAGMSFDALGGAVADVAADATAFPWRTALATVQHTATWSGPADPGPFDAVVAGTRDALTPWTGTAAYVNYADAGQPDRAAACWGGNRGRLQRVAAAADPDGVFAFPGGVRA